MGYGIELILAFPNLRRGGAGGYAISVYRLAKTRSYVFHGLDVLIAGERRDQAQTAFSLLLPSSHEFAWWGSARDSFHINIGLEVILAYCKSQGIAQQSRSNADEYGCWLIFVRF